MWNCHRHRTSLVLFFVNGQNPEINSMADNSEVSKGKYQPSEFLKSVLGRPVVVKLNSGVDYRGVLACLDGYMNIAMEQTEEYVGGELKAKYGRKPQL